MTEFTSERGPWPDAISKFVLFALVVFLTAGLDPLADPTAISNDATSGGDAFRQVTYSGLLILVLAAVRPNFANLVRLFPPLLLIVLGWCVLSIAWSATPDVAVRRIILTMIMITTVFTAVAQLGPAGSIQTVQNALLLTLVLNYCAVLLSPYGVHTYEPQDENLIGNWKGLTPHKNYVSVFCVFTILFFLSYKGKMPARNLLAILAAAFFLFETKSKTSMGMAVFAIAATMLIFGIRRLQRQLALAISVLVASAVFITLWVYQDQMLGLLDDPKAFTGRGEIWAVLWEYAGAHPLLGAGYGSFWNTGGASLAGRYDDGWVSGLQSGHSGYLDVLVQIGFPGLIMSVLAIFVLPLWYLISSRSIPRDIAFPLIAGMIFCIGHNATETSLLERDLPAWFFTLVCLGITQSIRSEQSAWVEPVNRASDPFNSFGDEREHPTTY